MGVEAGQLPGIRWVGTDPLGRVGVGVAAGRSRSVDADDASALRCWAGRAGSGGNTAHPGPAGSRIERVLEGHPRRQVRRYRRSTWRLPVPCPWYRHFRSGGCLARSGRSRTQGSGSTPSGGSPASRDVSTSGLQASVEYGAFQYLQAPDAAKFTLYWRPDSLMTDVTAEVEVISETIVDGELREYELELSTGELGGCLSLVFPWLFNANVENLPRFASGYLTNVLTAGERLPARDRRRYRIATIIDDRRIRLAPTSTVFVSGRYRVVNDPHAVETWQKLMPDMKVWPPVEGKIVGVEKPKPVTVTARRIRQIPERPDVLTMLPRPRVPGIQRICPRRSKFSSTAHFSIRIFSLDARLELATRRSKASTGCRGSVSTTI